MVGATTSIQTWKPWSRLRLENGLALNTDIVVEPMTDPEPGQDRAFSDIGAYLNALNLSYETDTFIVLVG